MTDTLAPDFAKPWDPTTPSSGSSAAAACLASSWQPRPRWVASRGEGAAARAGGRREQANASAARSSSRRSSSTRTSCRCSRRRTRRHAVVHDAVHRGRVAAHPLDERSRAAVVTCCASSEVVDALAYAHGRGVVHRDIKPGNILMSGTHAVVTDFGVAKALSAAHSGRWSYHQRHGDRHAGLHGARAARGRSSGRSSRRHLRGRRAGVRAAHRHRAVLRQLAAGHARCTTHRASTAPHVAQSDIPPALSALIMHCLEKDASQRPQTASALLHELDAVEITVRDEAASAAYATSARSRHAMIAVLAVVAVATSIFAITRDRPQAELLASARNDTTGRAAAAETVVVFRDVPVGRDQAEGITLPLGLSRAESLQIAQQMGSRTTPGDAPASARADIVDRDSLLAAVSRSCRFTAARSKACSRRWRRCRVSCSCRRW